MAQEPVFQYTHVEAGLIENVVLRPTEAAETYPSGWKYTLHLGTLEDLTLVRFDNAHEDTKGHEHHTAAGDVDDVTFPGPTTARIVGYAPREVVEGQEMMLNEYDMVYRRVPRNKLIPFPPRLK